MSKLKDSGAIIPALTLPLGFLSLLCFSLVGVSKPSFTLLRFEAAHAP